MSSAEKIAKIIKKGNIEKLAELLQQPSTDINELDPKSGKTLIQISMQNEQKQAFEMLIKSKGIQLDTTSKQGETVLQTAILMNSAYFVEQILRSKFNSKHKNNLGYSALFTAIKNKSSPQIISKLLSFGFNPNEEIAKFGSLLNAAIEFDNFQSFSILLEHPKTDIKITDEEENTCLILSVKQKKGNFVQSILKKIKSLTKQILSDIDKQFFVNACDKNGDTALHIAAKRNYQTILDILTKQSQNLSIDLQAKNKQGKTYKQIYEQVLEQAQKQRRNEQYQQKKRAEQKVQKYKQKEEQKIRLAKEQEQQIILQKKKRKEEQKLEAQKRQMAMKLQKNRKIWAIGIFLVIVLGVMYLAFLGAVQKSKISTEGMS